MKFLRFLILPAALFGTDATTCYSVQILSTTDTQTHRSQIEKMTLPKECQIMNVSSHLTVRCGCFQSYKEAKEEKAKLGKGMILKTYAWRFQKELSKTAPKKQTPKPTPKPKLQPTPKPIKTNKDKNTTTPVVENIILLDDETTTATKIEKKETIKPIIAKMPTSVATPSKTEKKSIKRHKKKKKKKKKVHKRKKEAKIVKKKPVRFFYDRYIARLKKDKGIGKFDYRYEFGARISYDIGYVDEASEQYFEREIRRARLSHKGSFFHKKLFYLSLIHI